MATLHLQHIDFDTGLIGAVRFDGFDRTLSRSFKNFTTKSLFSLLFLALAF
jgi:hypothetical protein